jgi:hypothetical protein
MNGDVRHHQIRETGWRRKLTEAERAELRAGLAAEPEAEADLEAEAALTEVLSRLSDAPVASNFTARVLQAVERETAARSHSRMARWSFWWQSLSRATKAATVALVVGVSVAAYHRHQVATRTELAESLVAVADVKSLPAHTEILKDFEAIRLLSQTPPADEELLALLQ